MLLLALCTGDGMTHLGLVLLDSVEKYDFNLTISLSPRGKCFCSKVQRTFHYIHFTHSQAAFAFKTSYMHKGKVDKDTSQ